MAVYKAPSAGTKVYRTRVPLANSKRQFDLTYGEVVPVMQKFVLPGDVWKIGGNMLIRYKPMLSPTLTESTAFVRYFFVPLRQVVDNIEEIITGSKNGSLVGTALPTCPNFVEEYLRINGTPSALTSHCAVNKYSYLPMTGVRPTKMVTKSSTVYHYENYDAEIDNKSFQRAYFYRAYCKVIFEYFRDENYQSFDGDFEKFYEYMLAGKHSDEVSRNGWYYSNGEFERFCGATASERYGGKNFKVWFCDLRKDYFTSSLPWVMKGVQPSINIFGSSSIVTSADFTQAAVTGSDKFTGVVVGASGTHLGGVQSTTGSQATLVHSYHVLNSLNNNSVTFDVGEASITAQDIRDMFAETRVFERLARCGSRYVEYLESNFGIAPRDDTLQRPLYLGGFSQPIVTTEVVQTGGDTQEVGTMRGHGISSGGNRIKPFVASEFGIILGLMYVTPKTQYLFQNKREYSYASRFDFVNPSFQLLSEQEVNALEFFTPRLVPADGETVDVVKFKPFDNFTLGFQGMYNELRYDQDVICRDMADTLSFWNQAVNPSVNLDGYETTSVPPLNGQNICVGSYLPSLLRPFESNDPCFRPMIVDFGTFGEVFRPLVRDPIPGMIDHN